MNAQMIRVISSPSSSTIGFLTLIFGHRRRCYLPGASRRCRTAAGQMPQSADGNRRAPDAPATTRSPTSRRRCVDYNVFEADRPLVEAVAREGADWAERADRARVGALAGSERDAASWGRLANENPPKLRTHDRYGNRIDEVEFHPAWHELMAIARRPRAALAALAATRGRAPTSPAPPPSCADAGRGRLRLPDLDDLLGDPGAAHAARARRRVGAALPLRRLRPAQRSRPPEKAGALAGMAMTEKQGGSDVRANTTVARAAQRRRPRRRVRAHRPQVVLLGADVRRLPRPRPDRRRPLLLPAAALDARRRAQPLPHPAAQGQARQPLQRLQRGRVPRRLGAAGRRGGPRRARRSSRWSATPASTA